MGADRHRRETDLGYQNTILTTDLTTEEKLSILPIVVCPVYAGMKGKMIWRSGPPLCLPRVRGDESGLVFHASRLVTFTPCVRG